MSSDRHIHTEDAEFWQRFPHCQFKNTHTSEGPVGVLSLFGSSWQNLCDAWEPLVLQWSSGEDYTSYVYALVKNKNNEFAEIHGGTSSQTGLAGCWEPEAISLREMEVALKTGWLRAAEDNPLRTYRDAAAKGMGLDLSEIDRTQSGNPWANAKPKKPRKNGP